MSKAKLAIWLAVGIGAGVALSGCDSIRQATGAAKVPPDEFTVLTKSPLVIPPDFNLRPPQPGIASRNDPDADETGGALALPQAGATAASLAAYSDGEQLLLNKTKALSVDANIRKTITQEIGQENQGAAFAQKVLFDQAKPAAPATAPMAAAAPAMTPPAAPAAAPTATATPAAAPVTPAPAAPAQRMP